MNALVLDANDDLNRPSVIDVLPVATAPTVVVQSALAGSGIHYLIGTASSEAIAGTSADDIVIAGGGDDTATGGGGNDHLDGGAGFDSAVFSGNRADYAVVANGDGTLTVTDSRVHSPDGTDLLVGFERLVFADGSMPPPTGPDFNGDHVGDLLFKSTAGTYATWEMSAHGGILGGGSIGQPGSNWQLVATGDFNGDGKADVLFKDAAGNLAEWQLNDTAVVGGGTIGNPGAAWTFKGTGDFNGNGRADLLFENAGGTYANWEMDGTSVIGGGTFGSKGTEWHLL